MHLALDVSNVNPATLEQVRASRAKLLLCKATEGDGFKDRTLAAHRKIAAQLGIRFGSYLFLHTGSKTDEADFYLRYAKPRPGELVIIDAERGGQDGRDLAALARRAHSCALELEAHGHRPILYCSAADWKTMIAAVPGLKRLRVWEAQYPGRVRAWSVRLKRLRWRLGRGASVVMWQFTDCFEAGGKGFDGSAILVRLGRL